MTETPTIEREISGTKYVFKSKPTAKDILAIQGKDIKGRTLDDIYRDLAKFLIVEPVMTDEAWGQLPSVEYHGLVDVIFDLTGIDKWLFRVFKSTK
jgi:hypothetical protein